MIFPKALLKWLISCFWLSKATGFNGANGFGVYGSHNGSGSGVYGTTLTGTGIYGNATGTGTGGYFTGAATGFALRSNGPIRLGGIGSGSGKVLTSDAAGNATWKI